MSDPLPNPANKVMREVLSTIADGYDSVRPGAGDCVREFAEEKYPTCAEQLQHLANLCDRHKRDLLPAPTESICADCTAEREAAAKGEYVLVADELPPDNEVVMTKIDDASGCRNEQLLKRQGRLWFTPDGSMYVYYTPTHWR